MDSVEAVRRAIHFNSPAYIPIIQHHRFDYADAIGIKVENHWTGPDKKVSEWGFTWEDMDFPYTLGQTKTPAFKSWSEIDSYRPPAIDEDIHRFNDARRMMAQHPNRYYLADFVLTGFTLMSFVRGFEDLLADFILERENVERLADIVFAREEELIRACSEMGFHGIGFADDMGTQNSLIFSLDIFREIFKPRLKRQFDLVHSLGMDAHMHSCGYIVDALPELIEIGLDVINPGQPSLNGIELLGQRFGDKICFSCPVSYQTTGVSGTPQDIENEVLEYIKYLSSKKGGLLALILEDTYVLGNEENQRAIVDSFERYCGWNHTI